jgi:hypothetical protein
MSQAGLRESNVCALEWAWEVGAPELDRSVFVIPPEAQIEAPTWAARVRGVVLSGAR